MGTINFQKFPTWVPISITAILLLGGVVLADSLVEPTDEAELDVHRDGPLFLFIVVGVVVYIIEAMVFTFIPIELSAKFSHFPWLGAAVGVILYGPLYHGSYGVFSVLISSWIAFVLNSSYMVLRQRSCIFAIIYITGFKIILIFYAAFSIYNIDINDLF